MVAALCAALVGATPARAAAPPAPGQARAEHDCIVAFWTPARVAKAVPRDFVLDPATKKFQPTATRITRSTGVLGTSWIAGGEVLKTTGKVLFALGTS